MASVRGRTDNKAKQNFVIGKTRTLASCALVIRSLNMCVDLSWCTEIQYASGNHLYVGMFCRSGILEIFH